MTHDITATLEPIVLKYAINVLAFRTSVYKIAYFHTSSKPFRGGALKLNVKVSMLPHKLLYDLFVDPFDPGPGSVGFA